MATPPVEPGSEPAPSKPIHSLVLDTGPLIKNDPPASVLVARAERLYMLPSVLPEIRDPATRARVETTLLPFVTLRSPRLDSVRFVQAFARKTGDLEVLSRTDVDILALAYELECERNAGDWRLRRTPCQKGLNGRPPQAGQAGSGEKDAGDCDDSAGQDEEGQDGEGQDDEAHRETHADSDAGADPQAAPVEPPESSMHSLSLTDGQDDDAPSIQSADTQEREPAPAVDSEQQDEADDSDSDGWITPSNVRKHQARDAGTAIPAQPAQQTLQAAVLTSDYAMQNVALRINLNLVTPALARITRLKNWVLRCHGCFALTRDMARRFCPSCGQPTLLRASCSTDEHGNFSVHLKKNFQWNKRGNVYSVPKPVHGSASGRLPRSAGGGKDGWGRDLILAEDQKEYVRAADEQRRARAGDLMDDDRLPGILTGDRSGGSGGRIRVGAGRNVNAKHRHR